MGRGSRIPLDEVEPIPGKYLPPGTLQKLNSRHRLMVFMKANGTENAEVAHLMGMTRQHMDVIVQSPIFAKAVDDLQNEMGKPAVKAHIENLLPEAVNVIHNLMLTADSEQVRIKAAIEFLDRSLGRSVQKQEIDAKVDVRGVYIRLDQLERQAEVVATVSIIPDSIKQVPRPGGHRKEQIIPSEEESHAANDGTSQPSGDGLAHPTLPSDGEAGQD